MRTLRNKIKEDIYSFFNDYANSTYDEISEDRDILVSDVMETISEHFLNNLH